MSFTTLVVSRAFVARRVGHADPDRVRALAQVAGGHGRGVLGRRARVIAALDLVTGRAVRAPHAHAVGAVLVRVPGDVGARVRGADQGVGDQVDHHAGRGRVLHHARGRRPVVAPEIGHADADRVRALAQVAGAHGRRVLGRRGCVDAARDLGSGRAARATDADAVGTDVVRMPCDVGARVRGADQRVGDRVDRHGGRGQVLHHPDRLRAQVAGRIDDADPDRVECLAQVARAHRRRARRRAPRYSCRLPPSFRSCSP